MAPDYPICLSPWLWHNCVTIVSQNNGAAQQFQYSSGIVLPPYYHRMITHPSLSPWLWHNYVTIISRKDGTKLLYYHDCDEILSLWYHEMMAPTCYITKVLTIFYHHRIVEWRHQPTISPRFWHDTVTTLSLNDGTNLLYHHSCGIILSPHYR